MPKYGRQTNRWFRVGVEIRSGRKALFALFARRPHERERRFLRPVLDPREPVGELDRILRRLQHRGPPAAPSRRGGLRGALDGAKPGERELARVRAGEAGVGVEPRVVPAPDHLLGRAAEDVGHDLCRVVSCPCPAARYSSSTALEDVELHRGCLVVSRELEIGVQEGRLPEVVRPGVERRADPDEELAPRGRLLPPLLDRSVVDRSAMSSAAA